MHKSILKPILPKCIEKNLKIHANKYTKRPLKVIFSRITHVIIAKTKQKNMKAMMHNFCVYVSKLFHCTFLLTFSYIGLFHILFAFLLHTQLLSKISFFKIPPINRPGQNLERRRLQIIIFNKFLKEFVVIYGFQLSTCLSH